MKLHLKQPMEKTSFPLAETALCSCAVREGDGLRLTAEQKKAIAEKLWYEYFKNVEYDLWKRLTIQQINYINKNYGLQK